MPGRIVSTEHDGHGSLVSVTIRTAEHFYRCEVVQSPAGLRLDSSQWVARRLEGGAEPAFQLGPAHPQDTPAHVYWLLKEALLPPGLQRSGA